MYAYKHIDQNNICEYDYVQRNLERLRNLAENSPTLETRSLAQTSGLGPAQEVAGALQDPAQEVAGALQDPAQEVGEHCRY